jgi:NADPH-dependent 2,4-dienoyl-CoA reductase/sulfur reductase-like enzyme
VLTGVSVTAIEPDVVELSTGERVSTPLVLLAAGVTPESGLARAAGLALSAGGGVVVDDQQRTSDPHVFAVGDVAVKRDAISGEGVLVPLAQTANRHGRLVADAIVGRPVTARAVLGTAVVGVFGLTVASVGWNERRARAADRPVRVIHTHPNDHAAYYPGAEQMTLKLIVDPPPTRSSAHRVSGGPGLTSASTSSLPPSVAACRPASWPTWS